MIRGVPHGKGVLQYASGDKYQGEFRHGKPEGQGVLNYTNGDHYEGAVMTGTFEGKGVYYFHTSWSAFSKISVFQAAKSS